MHISIVRRLYVFKKQTEKYGLAPDFQRKPIQTEKSSIILRPSNVTEVEVLRVEVVLVVVVAVRVLLLVMVLVV